MDTKEHFYADDPKLGHPDVRTTLGEVDYFFLGNGHVQAVVQVCGHEEATPLGLLVQSPDHLGPKRACLTLDENAGLARTRLEVLEGECTYVALPGTVQAAWTEVDGVPAVIARWGDPADIQVEERAYCPDRSTPRLVREVRVRGEARPEATLTVRSGDLEREATLREGASDVLVLVYELIETNGAPDVRISWGERPVVEAEARRLARARANYRSDSDLADHVFTAARNQLPAVLRHDGKMDGSIWQYNLEWVRDQAAVVGALAMLGETELAGRMVRRLLTEFVTPEGDTVDSGRTRAAEDVELDQNGELLTAVHDYVRWIGDTELLREHWPTLRAVAAFPLREEFRHAESGLLHNRREYWERHAAHGIEDGMELTYQSEVAAGLLAAAELADHIGEEEDAQRWRHEGERLRVAMLEHPTHSLVEDGYFTKRRRIDGTAQREVVIDPDVKLAPGIPLFWDIPHLLNPDTSTVLPIATGFIDPQGALARRTLEEVEQLWNLHWEGGGYSRYHTSSEGDSPGPWPFASLFVARAWLEAGDAARAWRVFEWLATTPGARAGTWFEFYGDRPVPPCPPVGITPWTWAEIIRFFVHHHLGVRPGLDELVLRPRLLPGMDRVEATIPVRGHRLPLTLRRAAEGEPTGFRVGDQHLRGTDAGLRIPLPTAALPIEATVA